jgi:S1-C subfamily serine protease
VKFGSLYETTLVSRGHRHVLTRILAATGATALATGLIMAFSAPSSSGSSASRQGSGLVPSPANRPALIASTGRGITARVQPGVVIIDTRLRYDNEVAAGTGMVINPDGLVLTNNHVIEDATSITATVAGKTYPARVVGYDKTDDIALIQLQGAARLPTVPVGNSSQVKVGQMVVALGNAGGRAIVAVSQGKVAKLNLIVTASDQVGSTSSETLHGMMQANATIEAGDSGGPLSSTNGVIGMDTAANNSGRQRAAGFAIPINTALSIAGQIAAGKASSDISIGYPPFMGTFVATGSNPNPVDQTWQDRSEATAPSSAALSCYTSSTGLAPPPTIAPASSGVLVRGVICGSPAARAGMTAGAVITAVSGQPVRSPDDLMRVMARFRPGDTIFVGWTNPAGKRATSRIRLIEGPAQ